MNKTQSGFATEDYSALFLHGKQTTKKENKISLNVYIVAMMLIKLYFIDSHYKYLFSNT